jgi:hypothetical protein
VDEVKEVKEKNGVFGSGSVSGKATNQELAAKNEHQFHLNRSLDARFVV